jgi:hypothetical protein
MNTGVVTRRWDGLGGRLQALLNAWSVARSLEVDFRFAWPRNDFIELREPLELFSATFLERFEITEAAAADAVRRPDLNRLSIPEARELFRADAVALLEVDEIFEVFAFAGESAEVAQRRFAAGLGEIGWSAAARSLIQSVAQQSAEHGYAALHIRAGDIVTGDWRQFVPVDKYLPTPLVEFAITELAGPDHRPVVIVSDNEPYVRHLKSRFLMLRSPADLVPDYAQLTCAQRAFADIMILAQARQLAGPCQSAFSRLAAHLGHLPLPRINEWVAEGNALGLLRDRFVRAEKEGHPPEMLRPLLARDICWFLDVFSDDCTPAEQYTLADRAVRFDPDFCGALNRSALARARAGDRQGSEAMSDQARVLAARAHRHADPMVESLATTIASTTLLQSITEPGSAPRTTAVSLLSRIYHFCRGPTRNAVLEEARRTLAECQKLAPYQIQHPDVMQNLRYQVSMLAWLTGADDPLRREWSVALRHLRDDVRILSAWRPSGYRTLGWPGSYPQVLRNVEGVTILMAGALGTVLSRFSRTSRPPARGQTDSMLTSSSGLHWIIGWAHDTRISRTQLAIGYEHEGSTVSGGVTFLPRSDVASVLTNPAASMSGFAIPVPSVVTELGDDRRAALRVQPRMGLGSFLKRAGSDLDSA